MEKGIVEYCQRIIRSIRVCCPFFLNVVHLKIGEGLFIRREFYTLI